MAAMGSKREREAMLTSRLKTQKTASRWKLLVFGHEKARSMRAAGLVDGRATCRKLTLSA